MRACACGNGWEKAAWAPRRRALWSAIIDCMKRIAIIGGGAAGLACAVSAALGLRALGRTGEVVLFERDDRIGRTVLATGNGRCNFSNSAIDLAQYNNADFVAQTLAALEEAAADNAALSWLAPAGTLPPAADSLVSGNAPAPDAVHRFFALLGLEWREEQDGRQYPLANKASSVLDVLRFALDRFGVVQRCDCTVSLVDPPHGEGSPYTLRTADGVFERADAVVVAVGGKSCPHLQVATWQPPSVRPVLGPLATDTALIKELNNIRVRARATLLRSKGESWHKVAAERGEVMFRKYGLSGIAVFNLSRYAQPGDQISIDFLAESAAGDACGFCLRRARLLRAANSGLTLDDFLRGLVLPQVAHVLLKSCGQNGAAVASTAALEKLACALTDFRLTVRGIGDEANCQVQRGGYPVSLVGAKTLEAREFPGLYLVGEALDVDGPCGGYNLHWAWASGLLAGCAAARV